MAVNIEMRPFERQRDFGSLLFLVNLTKEETEIVHLAYAQRDNPFVNKLLKAFVSKLMAFFALISEELELRGCGRDARAELAELEGELLKAREACMHLLKQMDNIL